MGGGFPPHMGWQLLIHPCWHRCTYYSRHLNSSLLLLRLESIFNSARFCVSLLKFPWRTSHGADLMYGVYESRLCQSLSPLPYKTLYVLLFISLPALGPLSFIDARQLYPSLFALLAGVFFYYGKNIKWPIQTSEVYMK